MKLDPAEMIRRDAQTLFMGAIVPRPIAWVSTVGQTGIFNLAPYSAYTVLCMEPAVVCFNIGYRRDGSKKDTMVNIEWSKDFVINTVDERLAEVMNQTSAEYPLGMDEFKECGLTPVKSDLVKAPRVGESPLNLECKLLQVLDFGEVPKGSQVVIGEVLRVHIKDDCYADGEIQMSKLKAVARLGGQLYCRTTATFEMKRPYYIV
ncbi:MAG: flavin reductase family protein [Dehalococcoidia bacterium]|nr:flavin reductase family protein [Dehalococcoidia bacterium]